jgi:putative heme-binding domain-containing protein
MVRRNQRSFSYAFLVGFLILAGVAAQAQHDPETELASFQLPEGFEATLFASEKDGIVKPIQMRWDARGRLWVIGSQTYPQIKPGEEPDDKVWILEDTDGDGKADKTTVFADGLMIPTGLEIAHGGVRIAGVQGAQSAILVGEGTKLWFMADTDGDDRADVREVLYRGFGTGDNHQNINSFRWSPGGELFFCQGLHAFSRIETAHGIVALEQAGLWRWRPRERRLDAFYGGAADPQNPWGWAWDAWGFPFVVAGNNGAMFFPLPELLRGVQGGRRDSIWKEGRGRKTSGPEFLESSAFPPDWQGVLLAGGYINNAVWTLKVEDAGSGFRIVDHPTLPPLVRSSHGAFRPVDVKLGPDGAVYVCDWYNPIIGHYQASFRHPDRDKAHGRIWRIAPRGAPRTAALKSATPADLAAALLSPEGHVRTQATRLLTGLPTAEALLAVRDWLEKIPDADPHRELALVRALHLHAAHETPNPELLREALEAEDPNARAQALLIGGRWGERLPESFEFHKDLLTAAGDDEPRVRLAAIVAAGEIATPDMEAVLQTAEDEPQDAFIRLALQSARRALADPPVLAASAPPMKTTVAVPAAHGTLRATPEYVAALSAEVRARGDATRGAQIFQKPELLCLTCHKVGPIGAGFGPALDALGSAQPLDFIIGAVLEPQREIKEGFETYTFTLRDGKTIVGSIVAGTSGRFTVRDPAGVETTLAAADVREKTLVGSLMPAGLVDRLTREELRDLFAYLASLGKPGR